MKNRPPKAHYCGALSFSGLVVVVCFVSAYLFIVNDPLKGNSKSHVSGELPHHHRHSSFFEQKRRRDDLTHHHPSAPPLMTEHKPAPSALPSIDSASSSPSKDDLNLSSMHFQSIGDHVMDNHNNSTLQTRSLCESYTPRPPPYLFGAAAAAHRALLENPVCREANDLVAIRLGPTSIKNAAKRRRRRRLHSQSSQRCLAQERASLYLIMSKINNASTSSSSSSSSDESDRLRKMSNLVNETKERFREEVQQQQQTQRKINRSTNQEDHSTTTTTTPKRNIVVAVALGVSVSVKSRVEHRLLFFSFLRCAKPGRDHLYFLANGATLEWRELSHKIRLGMYAERKRQLARSGRTMKPTRRRWRTTPTPATTSSTIAPPLPTESTENSSPSSANDTRRPLPRYGQARRRIPGGAALRVRRARDDFMMNDPPDLDDVVAEIHVLWDSSWYRNAPQGSATNIRVFVLYRFLSDTTVFKNDQDDVDMIIGCDSRDTLFQSNPFDAFYRLKIDEDEEDDDGVPPPPPPGVFVVSEAYRYHSSSTNRFWVKSIMSWHLDHELVMHGGANHSHLKDMRTDSFSSPRQTPDGKPLPVICSGLIIGRGGLVAFREVVRMQMQVLEASGNKIMMHGTDQAALHIVVYFLALAAGFQYPLYILSHTVGFARHYIPKSEIGSFPRRRVPWERDPDYQHDSTSSLSTTATDSVVNDDDGQKHFVIESMENQFISCTGEPISILHQYDRHPESVDAVNDIAQGVERSGHLYIQARAGEARAAEGERVWGREEMAAVEQSAAEEVMRKIRGKQRN